MGIGYTDEHEEAIRRVEREFSRLIREAVKNRRFGQFGIVASIQSGSIKTFQKHNVETMKPGD